MARVIQNFWDRAMSLTRSPGHEIWDDGQAVAARFVHSKEADNLIFTVSPQP